NNIAGLSIANHNASTPLIVEHNLIRMNNLTGPLSGTGIYTDQFNAGGTLTSALINDNTFDNNQNAAVLFGSTQAGSQSNVGISNNIMAGNGNAILLFNTVASFVTGNTMTGSFGSQVVLGGGVNDVSVSENIIDGGASRGIR